MTKPKCRYSDIFLVCVQKGRGGEEKDLSDETRRETKERGTSRDGRAAAAVAAAAEGAVARDEMREERVEEAEDRDVNHNM